MFKTISQIVALSTSMMLMGCALPPARTRTPDPAEPLKDARMAPLLGSWKLIRMAPDGHAPANPGQERTLVFANGVAYADLWEHQLTYDYKLVDDTHLEMTWTASTNTNDKVGAVINYSFAIAGDELTLNRDVYQRVVKAVPTSAPITTTATSTAMVSTDAYHDPSATLEPNMTEIGLNQPFTLSVNESARIQGTTLSIKFLSVPNDSRCPRQVNCVWTGAADVEVEVTNATDTSQIITFDTNPAPTLKKMKIVVGDCEIELVQLTPYPENPEPPIQQNEYRAELVVRAK